MSEEIIDSHQHFWRIGAGHYGWLKPENAKLYRDFGPDALLPIVRSSCVSGTILVQAADTEAELPLLTDYAEKIRLRPGHCGAARSEYATCQHAHPTHT